MLRIDADPCFKDITIGTANLLLDRAEAMTEQELIACFSRLGVSK